MIEFIEYLLKLIVNHPEEVKVEENHLGENAYQYRIYAHQEDVGKIIGKNGKTVQSIRNVAKILAVKENKQIRVEIAE